MIAVNINVTRIDKTALYEGKNGKYLSLTLHENKGGKDKFSNDGFVSQDIGKERRMKGEQGEILGNYKIIGGLIGATDHDKAKGNGFHPQYQDDSLDDVPF